MTLTQATSTGSRIRPGWSHRRGMGGVVIQRERFDFTD